jgi:predicted nucleic acid-binding Zn ribbon protein
MVPFSILDSAFSIHNSTSPIPMLPIQRFSSGVLAEVIRRQPSSPARTSLAWQVAAGAALAKVTTVELVDGVLHVRARDRRWLREIRDMRQQVLLRVQHLLGNDVTALKLEAEELP